MRQQQLLKLLLKTTNSFGAGQPHRWMGSISVSAPPAPSQSATDPHEFAASPEEKRRMYRTEEASIYKLGKHRSNALELVHQVPIIEVDGEMAICDGGGGALGHPLEYISLSVPGTVEYCKYCNLRYTKKKK